MSLCILAAGKTVTLAVAAFTLSWTHSVERTRWQEDWQVLPSGLQIVAARVKGSGAGMEPPPQARLIDGWFQWRPEGGPKPQLVLANSGAAGEWRLCQDRNCKTLSDIFGHPIGANVTTMSSCNDL
jgi:hypothetical protein